MAPYKNVAIAGASGNIGAPVLKALLASGKFNVTVISRGDSTATFPNEATVKRADYSSHDSLVAALRGNEALILTVGDPANHEKIQKAFIDAAIDAGVKRVLPSEFGTDISIPPGKDSVVFAQKVATQNYLKQKASEGKISWTSVYTGPFLDWGLDTGFIGIQIKERKATLYDDGQNKFSTTTLDTVGRGVVGVLLNPEATENRGIRLSDAYVTLREILEVVEAEVGSKFETTSPRIPDVLAASNAAAAKGDFGLSTAVGWIAALTWGEESSSRWEKNDHSLIGLPDQPIDWKDFVRRRAQQLK